MTTPQQPHRLPTPPFGQPSGPEFHPTQPIGDYRGQDFPAPAGVPQLGASGAAADQAAQTAASASSAAGPYGTGYASEPTIVQPLASAGIGAGVGPTGPAAPAGGTATLTRTKRPAGMIVVAAALSAVIGAGAGIAAYAVAGGGGSVGSATSPISVTGKPAANTPVLDGTVAAAAKQISPSVVTITVQSSQGGGVGTGVVLDKDGHILTNDHVVSEAASSTQQGQQGQQQDPYGQGQQDPNQQGQQDPNQPGQQDQQQGGSTAADISVTFDDGTTEKATVVGTSDTNDLAVIKVAASDKLVPAAFAKTESLQVGQSVVAVGAPLGLSDTVTSGIVSNTARPVRSGVTNDAVYLAVQTDAAINPGNSGGPLVNLNGDVVGINSSIASTGSGDSGGQSGNIGIGFAIPSDVASRVATELIKTGKYTNAALGVSVGGNDSTAVSTDGVALQSVTADCAAAKAGLTEGDQVTKINDFSTTTADGLIAATRFYAPGTTVDVTYVRGGQTQTVKVTLGSA